MNSAAVATICVDAHGIAKKLRRRRPLTDPLRTDVGGTERMYRVATRFYSTVGGRLSAPKAATTSPGTAIPVAVLPPNCVRVTVGGHCYRTTVASMDGRFFVPLNADNRSAAGVAAGDEVDVEIVTDTAPREISVPDDLAEALAGDPTAATFFDGLSYTHRKEWVRWIEDAKKAGTRASRLTKTIASLHAGKRSR